MSRRAGPPPEIPGYAPGEPIGAGGFADVFLYREVHTERPVAVKVLDARMTDEARTRQFRNEANLMSPLSTHPYIVTIYSSGVTADGRPYLVMEYCSREDMAARIKRETLTVADVLQIGIRVAGALETAHGAGILHRDIKPANILTTDYGNPALTDFGIAAAVHDTANFEGLSVPWAPPEALRDPPESTAASDVYSLAATIWHLLEGHSPFALPQGPNGVNDLVHRIRNTPLPRMRRRHVPPGLERVLAGAMAKQAGDRPGTVLELARSLQAVERAAGYAETELVVANREQARAPRPTPSDDEPQTRFKGVVLVDPDVEATSTRAGRLEAEPVGTVIKVLPAVEPDDVAARTQARPVVDEPPVEDTRLRPRTASPEPEPAAAEGAAPPSNRRWLWAGAAAVVVAGGVVAAVVLGGGDEPTTPPGRTTSASSPVVDPGAAVDVVPPPTGLAGARQPDGSIVFTWQAADPADGASWVVRRDDAAGAGSADLVSTPSFTVTGVPAGGQACVEVSLRRDDGHTSAPAKGCAG